MIRIYVIALHVVMSIAFHTPVKNSTKTNAPVRLASNTFNISKELNMKNNQKQTKFDIYLRNVLNNGIETNKEIADIIALARKRTEIIKEKHFNPKSANPVKSVNLVDVNLLRKLLFLNYMYGKGAMLHNLGKPMKYDTVDTLQKMKLGSQYPKVAFEILDGQSLLDIMLSPQKSPHGGVSPSAVKPLSESAPENEKVYYQENMNNNSKTSNPPPLKIVDLVNTAKTSDQRFSMGESNIDVPSFEIEPTSTHFQGDDTLLLFPSQTALQPLQSDNSIDSLHVSGVEDSSQSITVTFTLSNQHSNVDIAAMVSAAVESSLSHAFPTLTPSIEAIIGSKIHITPSRSHDKPLLINVSPDAGLFPESTYQFDAHLYDSTKPFNPHDVLLRSRRHLLAAEDNAQLEGTLYSQETATSPNHELISVHSTGATRVIAADISSFDTPITQSIVLAAARPPTNDITQSTSNTTISIIEYSFTTAIPVSSTGIHTGNSASPTTVIHIPTAPVVSQESLIERATPPITLTTTTDRKKTTITSESTTMPTTTALKVIRAGVIPAIYMTKLTTAKPTSTTTQSTTGSTTFSWCELLCNIMQRCTPACSGHFTSWNR